ncbi:MAG: MG2 domain-containing protein [Candidatus Gracilibacteria bacterium]|nr:MG2 domain-containing protein [Candidatus Gracilibacteria bacterium]
MGINLFLENIKLYKGYIISALLFFVILVISFFGYNYFFASGLNVVAGNFDFDYRKIPFDVGYIDFTLSQDLDKSTITKDNFEINPKIDGELSLVGTNTIRYKFLEKLNIGDDISVTLKKSIKSIKSKTLEEDYNYIISVIDSPKVMKITPSGNLDNLSQNIDVFFNIPMISLSSLSGKDTLPCPILIEPKLDGECKWLTSSVLEYIPKEGFKGATKYEVKVNAIPGLLYKLSQNYGVEVDTTRLKYKISNKFHANDNIKINFNFAPNIENLESKLSLYEINDKGNKEKKNIYLTYDGANESNVIVNIKGEAYKFEKKYIVELDKGILPKYGNIATEKSEEFNLKSYPFLNSVGIFQNVYSGSKIVDTKSFYSLDSIPSKNLFLNLSFEDEISLLDKNNFILQDSNGKKVIFDIMYVKEKDTKTNSYKDNKKTIRLVLNENLKEGTSYTLIIKKGINLGLESDIVNNFKTSAVLEVKNFRFLSYSKSCLYLNNRIGGDIWTNINNIVGTIPASKTSSIVEGEYIDYKDQLAFGIKSFAKSNLAKITDEQYISKGYCPPAKDGESLYVLNTRLNPNSEYKIGIKTTFSDVYGSNLKNNFEQNVKTGNIEDKDKYLYISLTKDVNLIPLNLPLVVNLQTINLDNIDINVCELDKDGYIDYVQNWWNEGYTPKCLKIHNRSLVVNNNHWNLTNNKFDIEKDIVGKKLDSNFVLVRGNAGGRNQFSNMFIRSNLNVTVESGSNKKLLFVTDFTGGKVSDLNLEFLSYDYNSGNVKVVRPNYKLNEKTGVYEIDKIDDLNYIIVSNDKYFGIVDLNTNLFSDYDFNYVGGTPTYDTNYLYLYTERPIYKPGDTVYLKGLLRKFDFNGYSKSNIGTGKLEVLDKNFEVISSMDVNLDKNSNFNSSFVIPKDSPLGEFSFRFSSQTNDYYKNDAHFYIEEYRKPDFKIDVEGLESNYLLGDKFSLKILPKYYFGGNLVSTSGKYSVLSQNYFFDAKDYSDYQFGESTEYFDCIYWGFCNYSDNLSAVKGFSIDSNGKGTINYSFSTSTGSAEKIYTFNIEVEDKDTKKTVNKSVSTILHSTDSYVGLKTPYWNDKKNGISAKFIVLDYDAKPEVSKDIKVQIIKRDWKEVKKQGVDGIFYSDYALEEKKEQEINLKTNYIGEVSKTFSVKESGEYMVRAIYTGSNGKTFVSSRVVYVASDDYVSWYSPNNDTIELTPEKTQVLVGDNASYTLKSPINNGKALIIIEKDDGILDYFVHDIKSYGDKITFNVKDNYYPNFYVRAFLIGKQDGNDLPVYKRALASTKVFTSYKNLKVKISTDKKSYNPGDSVGITVYVTDSKGKPVSGVNGSLSLVDESLLALVGNPKKNPYAFFYEMKRYLGTLMYSSMINLIEKLEVKDISNGQKGGAGEQIKGGDSKKKRGVFKDTAYWLADFTTGADGKFFIKTDKLPDNLTTWEIEALVNSSTDNKIGVAYESITTTKTLIINDNLPNFFGVGDTIVLSPVVFNKTGKDGDFEVTLTGTNLDISSGNSRKVFVKNGESKTVSFEVGIKKRESFRNMSLASSKIDFKVSEVCSKNCNLVDQDEIEKVVLIKDSTTKESVSTIGKTNNNSFDEIIDLTSMKDKIGQLKINYSASLFNNLVDSIDYLNEYPYGCSEQKTSSVVKNVYIKSLYDSIGKDFDLKNKYITYFDNESKIYRKKSLDLVINEYLVDIRKFQNNDGGFVYWYDISNGIKNYSDFNLTAYILKSLSELKSIGYKQEDKVMLDALNYLKNGFYKNRIEGCIETEYNNCKYSDVERLSAIEAIQSYNSNDYEVYKMFKLLELNQKDTSTLLKKGLVLAKLLEIKTLSTEEKAGLQKTLDNDINSVINNELVYTPKGAYVGRTTAYTRLQNTSMLLKVLSVQGKSEISKFSSIIDNMNRWIMSQKVNGSFGSTQDNLYVIDAISDYIVVTGELNNINFNTILKLNSEKIGEKTINVRNSLDVFSENLSLNLLKDKNTFNISKTGVGTVYYDLNMDYFLTSKEVEARDEGFSIIKEYYDYNSYKRIDSLKKDEWQQYLSGKIDYEALRYKKSVFEYLDKLSNFQVGQLVVVRNLVITSVARDKVALESYIPSGAEIVNPNLETSSKAAFDLGDSLFDKVEYRQDRFFGYIGVLDSGIYNVSYLIRFTHAGEFYVKPAYISEFYTPEVFGRSAGEVMKVN